jgi:hypothetical protein
VFMIRRGGVHYVTRRVTGHHRSGCHAGCLAV